MIENMPRHYKQALEEEREFFELCYPYGLRCHEITPITEEKIDRIKEAVERRVAEAKGHNGDEG